MSTPTIPPSSSIPPGDGDSSPARLLAQALAQKSRAEEERIKSDARAAAAEATVNELRKNLEDARKSAAGGDGDSRAVRNLKEELEATKQTLDDNFKELGALRVQLRSQEEKLKAQDAQAAGLDARARTAEEKNAQLNKEAADLRDALTQEKRLRNADVAQLETFTAEVDRVRKALALAEEETTSLRAQLAGVTARAEISTLDAARSRADTERVHADLKAARDGWAVDTASLVATQQAHSALQQSLQAEMDAHQAARSALEAEKRALEVQTAALAAEQQARAAAQQAALTAAQMLETERAAMATEHAVLGTALMEAEQATDRARQELGTAQARVAELERGLQSAGSSAQGELAKLQKELSDAEADRKEAMERARKAEREGSLAKQELEALNTELRALRGSVAPPAAAAAPAANEAMADELAKAQKRLAQYGDEIKRLRDELASVGRAP